MDEPQVVFTSQEDLKRSIAPFSLEELQYRVTHTPAARPLHFRVDPSIQPQKIHALRNPAIGNLLQTKVYETPLLTVFYPEHPRVPHHLTIALNRSDIHGLSSVTEQENAALFAMIRKITEVYKTLNIGGFVIAQFDTPQEGHSGRLVVELIPHLPGFREIKHMHDKMGSYQHIFFRLSVSPTFYPMHQEEIATHSALWQERLQKPTIPLTDEDIKISFPHIRQESHLKEAEAYLYRHLMEYFENQGAVIQYFPPCETTLSALLPEIAKAITVTQCAFCNPKVIQEQLVYEYEDVIVLYNVRKMAKPGLSFLILPKEHIERVYGLSSRTIDHLGIVRQALSEVLKETHPACEVIVYTQDTPAVGQTVFHSHEQVVAVDSTFALAWTLMALYPSGNVSDEEMSQVRKDFGMKLDQKIQEILCTEKIA